MKFKLFIDKDRCKGCEYCVQACECGVLHMVSGINSSGHHYVEVTTDNGCIGCKKCADICPEAAIEIEKEEKG